MSDFLEELFSSEAIENTSNYKPTSSKNDSIIYKPDLKKVPDDKKARGYKAKLRFLPNVVTDIEWVKAYYEQSRVKNPNLAEWNENISKFLGPFQIERATLSFKNDVIKELNGMFDSLNNIDYKSPSKERLAGNGKYCPLTSLKFELAKSSNVVTREKANLITYNKKWYSYVLILEDEQQPELVGKIMLYHYGKQVNEKIEAEKEGVYGDKCNVQDLEKGKDFYLIINELEYEDKASGKKTKSPSYINSKFDNISPISISVDGVFKKPKLDADGKVSSKVKEMIQEMLLNREVTLESYAPKKWSDDQISKVNGIMSYLKGEGTDVSGMGAKPAAAFSFDEDEVVTQATQTTHTTEQPKVDISDDFGVGENFDFSDADFEMEE